MLGPLLFNIFINDLYIWVSKTDLLNFADDNTISTAENTIEKLISTLEQDSQVNIVEWGKKLTIYTNLKIFGAILQIRTKFDFLGKL